MRLSKSRLVAWLQCPKRLWLQQHRLELAAPSAAAANRMAQGHKVGAAAQTLFPGGVLVGHVDNLSAALRETEALLGKPGDVTLSLSTTAHKRSALMLESNCSARGAPNSLVYLIHGVAEASISLRSLKVPA